MDPEKLTERQRAALDVLGYYGLRGGWRTGGFKLKLISAMVAADPGNRAKLASVFPEVNAALRALDDSETALQKMADGED